MIKFSDLKLDPKVLKAIAEAGYESPTPIQQGAIPPALEGRDVLGIAQTGTGKTASFTLPMITLLGRGRARARMPRSLVLCPTRELAAQVAENFDTYAKHTRLTKALLIGGVSFGEQDKLIDRGVDVLIATPGRLLDHFERGKLLLTGVQIMVVDEADRMLDMGFIPDIERIFQMTPFTRQTLFFSATMAPEIERITNTFLHAPERVEIARQSSASETITQRLVEIAATRRDTASKQKRDLLRALIEAEGDNLKNAIIFCNRKTDVDIVAKSLAKYGYDAAPIHGDLEQSQRTRTLESFRDGKLRLLIASDVAARGLDIPAVSHVFNFDLPTHAEDYVHRIGRTGRAGRLGTAISIATPSDEKYLTAIESLLKNTLPRVDLPAGFSATGTPPARKAEEAPQEERKVSSRQRSRRGRRDDEKPAVVAEAAPVVAPQAAPQPEPAKPEVVMPEVLEQTRKETQPRQDSRPAAAPEAARRDDNRRDDSRRDNRRDGRRGNNDGNRGQQIVGMGDHVPRFMLVELRTTDTPEDADHGDDVVINTVQDVAPAPEAPAKPKRTRGRRKSASAYAAEAPAQAAPEAAPVQAAAVEAPAPQADAPQAVEPAAEAPAKRTRTRKPAATTTDATGDDAAKPKRTRARKPAAAEAPVADAAADVADKPKRTRRKKTDEAAPEVVADKPKRTRRTKAMMEADAAAKAKDAASEA
jgi:superfamily II DNA/RNA helicase